MEHNEPVTAGKGPASNLTTANAPMAVQLPPLRDSPASVKVLRQAWRFTAFTAICNLTELTMSKNGYYNGYESERIRLMSEVAVERSKQRPRSVADALAQMERLRQQSRRARSKSYKTGRKQACETGRKRAA